MLGVAEHSEFVLVDRPEPGVALVTLNRPERRNMLTAGGMAQLAEQLGARAALTIGSEFPEVRLKDLIARKEEAIDATAAPEAVSVLLTSPAIPPLLA